MKSKLIWSFLPLGIALVAGIFIISRMNGQMSSSTQIILIFAPFLSLLVALFLISKRPQNAIGWILLAGPFALLLTGFVNEWARLALLTQPGRFPLGLLAAWLSTWVWSLMLFPFFILLPLLFPTGRPISPKWRIVLKLAWLELGITILAAGLAPGPLEDLGTVQNPLGVEALAPFYPAIINVSTLGFLLLVGLALLSVFIRYRVSKDEERAQIKWFLFAASLLFLNAFRGITQDLFGLFPPLPRAVEDWAFATNLILIALAISIAILKFRLYDIDVIIRRTLIYGSLTSILALVYFGSVLLMQSLIPSLTGQNSQVAIILSTLIIAALFTPLRQRVQFGIDRRFFRRKYKAEIILASFTAGLQNELDPNQVSDHLVDVVQETMQPLSVSLWLK